MSDHNTFKIHRYYGCTATETYSDKNLTKSYFVWDRSLLPGFFNTIGDRRRVYFNRNPQHGPNYLIEWEVIDCFIEQ